jgi:superfamily II DNA or RNA helicase
MIDIIVHKVNEALVRVHCENHIAQELNTFFEFFAPGYKWTPAFKNRFWDGKIRLFNYQTRSITAGLVPYIAQFAADQDYTFEGVLGERPYSVAEAQQFVASLKLPFDMRDYQLDAFIHAVQAQRTVLVSPTASGKSLIIYAIVRHALASGLKKGVLVVPTTSLVEQMVSDFKSYGWDVEASCHKVYSGKERLSDKPLIVTTWQSLYTQPPGHFVDFNFVIGDEAHTFKAKSLGGLMSKLTNASLRIGTTGTLDGTKVHKLVLEGLFGPCKQVTTTKKLMDDGHISTMKIKCLLLKHTLEECRALRGKTYVEEIKYLVQHDKRNNFISNLALSLEGNTLVLYRFVESHGLPLAERIRAKAAALNVPVYFISGSVETKEREIVRKIVDASKKAIIVASYGTFSTGINIRNLHNVIFASPTKSRITVPQSIGRSLRLGDNKTQATLFDIADDLRVKTRENHTLTHFQRRLQLYNEEKFDYKIYRIDLGS